MRCQRHRQLSVTGIGPCLAVAWSTSMSPLGRKSFWSTWRLRCVIDAIQAVTGCKLGKRTLKYIDYDKVTTIFLNTTTSKAFRIVACDECRDKVWAYSDGETENKVAQSLAYKIMPDENLFNVMPVQIDLSPFDMPGHRLVRVTCANWGEGVNYGREVVRDKEVFFRPCQSSRLLDTAIPEKPESRQRLSLHLPAEDVAHAPTASRATLLPLSLSVFSNLLRCNAPNVIK